MGIVDRRAGWDWDERTVPATLGWTGFRGYAATEPPARWLSTHQLAEAGGYLRTGRYWMRSADPTPIEIPCVLVVDLYNPLLARVKRTGMQLMGYTVDY